MHASHLHKYQCVCVFDKQVFIVACAKMMLHYDADGNPI